MAPTPPDRKRKRGRPLGASKHPQDAPSTEPPQTYEQNLEDEEESRPKKRGHKPSLDNSKPPFKPKKQKHDVFAQPRKRGRPGKANAAGNEDRAGSEAQAKREAAVKPPKGQAQENENTPSSASRRSGHDRPLFGANGSYGTRPTNSSPTQFTSPPSDSTRMPHPPRRNNKEEPESPSMTPRRSERERRAWDPEKLFSGSGQNRSRQEESTLIVAARQGRERTNAPPEQGATTKKRKSRKQKPSVEDGAEKAQAPQGATGKDNLASSRRRRVPTPHDDQSDEKRLPRASRQGGLAKASSRLRKKMDSNIIEEIAALAPDTTQLARRGRKAANDDGPHETEADAPFGSRGPRRRPPNANVERQPMQEPAPAKPTRRESQQEQPEPEVDQDASSKSEDDEKMPYRYLKENIRNIPRSTIIDKWTPLDPPAVNAVSDFLADVQRPVLLRLQNTNQQRANASAAVGAMTRRLQSRLLRGYPFPAPTTKTATRASAASYEDDFNIEKTVDAKQALENNLNPLLHSVSVLEKQISKEEVALARDYEQLHKLEANARSAAHEWRDKAKRKHVLAPGIKKKGECEAMSRDQLEFAPAVEDGLSGGLFKDLEDQTLALLSQQVGSHMKSLKDNLQQIEGVVPAMAQSKAALQQVLHNHLNDEQYESVLFG